MDLSYTHGLRSIYDPTHIDADPPQYETEGSVGMDLRADVPEEVTIHPAARKLISTGLYLALPSGCEAQVRPRSGLALDEGLTVLNSPGTIDQDYRGDVGVILTNQSNTTSRIDPGQRIAQVVFAPVLDVELEFCDSLPDPAEAHEGFGSTGQK